MHFVQMFGKPLVLPSPVRLVGRVNVPEIMCNPTVASRWPLITPLQRVPQLALDLVFVSFEQIETFIRIFARDIEFYPNELLPGVHHRTEIKAAQPYAVSHP